MGRKKDERQYKEGSKRKPRRPYKSVAIEKYADRAIFDTAGEQSCGGGRRVIRKPIEGGYYG